MSIIGAYNSDQKFALFICKIQPYLCMFIFGAFLVFLFLVLRCHKDIYSDLTMHFLFLIFFAISVFVFFLPFNPYSRWTIFERVVGLVGLIIIIVYQSILIYFKYKYPIEKDIEKIDTTIAKYKDELKNIKNKGLSKPKVTAKIYEVDGYIKALENKRCKYLKILNGAEEILNKYCDD